MALRVEDGTGKSDADSYLAVDEFRALCADLGYALGNVTDEALEPRLRNATDYVDTAGRYKGVKSNAGQEREFPRDDLTDWSGHPVVGVPNRVKRATAYLAFKAGSGPLDKDEDRGGRVASKSVGPISISYEAGAPAGKVYTAAKKLLEQYMRQDGDRMNGPSFVSAAPIFDIGMHDAEGDA